MSSTTNTYPYRNVRFRLSIDGINIAGFNQVTISESSADAIEYREGDHPPYLGKQPGLIKYTNVVLKKGITQSQDLYKWFNDVKNGKLERKKAIIFLDDFAGKEVKKWVCTNCWPSNTLYLILMLKEMKFS